MAFQKKPGDGFLSQSETPAGEAHEDPLITVPASSDDKHSTEREGVDRASPPVVVSSVIHECDVVEMHGDSNAEMDVDGRRDLCSVSEGNAITKAEESASHRSRPEEFGRRRDSRLKEKGDSLEIKQPRILCPRVNCPEKIIICLDLSSEMERMTFRTRAGDTFSTLKLVKRALGLFVQSKHKLNRHHEFALVTVHESAEWLKDFTSDPREIVGFLDDLVETYACETFDISSLFRNIYSRIELPVVDDPAILPPPFVLRVLLIIGRSQSKLVFEKEELRELLDQSPYVFVDAFYVHELPSEENRCEEIFDQLCSLDFKGLSYIFEVSKNLTKLYDHMAQLLAHPLQRPFQKDNSYSIRPKMDEEEKSL